MLDLAMAVLTIPVMLFVAYKFAFPKRPTNFPPGPDPSNPFTGSVSLLQSMGPRAPLTFMKLGEKYGPICGIFLGRYPSVIINGIPASLEVLNREEFQCRPDLTVFSQGDYWAKGTLGSLWKLQHRISTDPFGDGGNTVETLIQNEVSDLIKYIIIELSSSTESVQMEELFIFSIIKIIWGLMSGKFYERDDPEFQKMIVKVKLYYSSGVGFFSLINDWPILKYFTPFSAEYSMITGNKSSVEKIIKDAIAENKRNRTPETLTNPKCLIDLYFNEMEKFQTENPDKKESDYFAEDELVGIFTGAFLAGIPTVSNALAFAMLYMLTYPEIQEKVQEELDNVLQHHRTATLADRPNLPYTEAVLMELLRIASPAPLAVPHMTSADTVLNGFKIPKDTTVNVNLYSMRMDISYWNDPEVFRPERFLDSDGQFVKPEFVLPFSMGARRCAGEPLATSLHFLFFVGMLQAFEVERVVSEEKPTLEPLPRKTEAPAPFRARLVSRT